MIKAILKAVTDPSPVPNRQDGDLPSRRARVQERIAILLPLDERPGVVILCLKGHYCVALEQEAPNLSGRYVLAHNWRALEAEAQREWQHEFQSEGAPYYEEGACVQASWSLERRARWNLSQPLLIQCQYEPGPRSIWRRLYAWAQGRASRRNER